MEIFYIDIATVIVIAFSIVLLIVKLRHLQNTVSKFVAFSFLLIFLIYSTLMFIEWYGSMSDTESIENLTGALLPIFWILFFIIVIEDQNIINLKSSEEHLNFVLKGASLGSWDWNITTGVVSFNDTYAEMLGYSLSELNPSAETWKSLIHPDDYQMAMKTLEDHLTAKTEFYELTHRLKTKDNNWRWILSRGKVLEFNEKNQPIRASGTHLDITVRKTLEEELNKKNEEYLIANEELSDSLQRIREINIRLEEAKTAAEQANILKTVFLANLSHEIRTPMNGIIGFASLLEESNISPESQREYISLIHKSGKRMLNLIEDLVNISKIDSGQLEIIKREVALNCILEKIYNFYYDTARNKGLNLVLNKREAENKLIFETDESRLEQILHDLIDNALKYTKDGTIEFGFNIEEHEIVFYVKDTGIGIPENMHELIFERFRQVDNNPHKSEEGNGLGLAICKAIIELMNGKIWVESKLMEGSTFYFSLPFEFTTRTENNGQKFKNSPIHEKDLTVLIVEDDNMSYILLREMLAQNNINHLYAENGKVAVSMVHDNPLISAILMDMKMPVMGGLEATKRIREFNPDIPIIAQTAYSSEEDKRMIMSAGCNDVISKPIDMHELIFKLADYF